ncbi:MAG: hypothetical protein ACSHXW_14705 [Yoonia sp.]
MTNKGLIADNYDHFLLNGQRQKAIRLVLRPLVDHLPEFTPEIDREKLLRAVSDEIDAVESLEDKSRWFDGFETIVEGLFDRLPERSKGSPQLFDEPEGDNIAGDPRFSERAFLNYIMGQFVEKAVAKQLILCAAQNGRQFSIIMPSEFSHCEEVEGFRLPAELDPFPIERFTQHWCEELGAERLWFAFSFELENDLKDILSTDSLSSGEATNTQKSGDTRRGFDVEDEPFVELAIDLLKAGRAKNPNDAMRMIEDGLWKEVIPEAGSFMAAVAGPASYDSKRMRLYRRVRSRWTAGQNETPK